MRLIFAWVAGFFLIGCGSAPQLVVPAPDGDSISMAIMDKQPSEQRYQLYLLTSSGLSGSGGMSAFNEKTTWSISLSDAERDRLNSAIRAAGWVEGDPAGEAEAIDRNTDRILVISTRTSSQRAAFEIFPGPDGFGPATAGILEALKELSARRFNDHVNRLPAEGDSIR